eukprot:tig00020610_g12007.t1
MRACLAEVRRPAKRVSPARPLALRQTEASFEQQRLVPEERRAAKRKTSDLGRGPQRKMGFISSMIGGAMGAALVVYVARNREGAVSEETREAGTRAKEAAKELAKAVFRDIRRLARR